MLNKRLMDSRGTEKNKTEMSKLYNQALYLGVMFEKAVIEKRLRNDTATFTGLLHGVIISDLYLAHRCVFEFFTNKTSTFIKAMG